jgi:alpha-L-rhamnosidase
MWHYIGDWYDALGIDPPAKGRGINFDTRQFFSNCFVVYGFQHAADIAGVLGKDADAARYQKLADDLRAAVHKAFYDAKNGCYAGCKEQTHLSAPLFTGVTPPAERERLQSALVENIKQTRSGHLTSGVLGTYLQLKHLTASRLDDLVAGAFKKRDYPSYGYFFDNGLTAVPEAWDISSGSRCHTSFLSGGAWFINGLAGIQPDPAAPAFKHFFVRPGAVRSTEWVKVEHSSIRGKICVAWRNVKKKFFLDVTIPPNSTATVRLPAPETSTVYEGDEPLTTRTGGLIKLQTSQSTGADAYLDVTLESGSYHFEVR